MVTYRTPSFPPTRVATRLQEYYRSRDKLRALKIELIEMAVELGQTQIDAQKGFDSYLDGWLAGAGSLPASRREE